MSLQMRLTTIAMQSVACTQGEKHLKTPSEGMQTPRRKEFVKVTGEGPVGQTMACLEMLARHHNVPFVEM